MRARNYRILMPDRRTHRVEFENCVTSQVNFGDPIGCHWTLDVTFGEDYCTSRALHAAENRATVTRIAVNLLNRYGRKLK